MIFKLRNNRRILYSPKYVLFKIYKKLEKFTPYLQSYYNYGDLNNFEKFVLIIEDRRYFNHNGFDLKAILREMVKTILTFKKPFGASTIEMQFVRTISNNYDLTLKRKIKEIFYAWLLNFHASKKVILRSYLDNAYFGTGLLGSEEASSILFGKSSDELNNEEEAFLASCLVNPIPRDINEAWREKVKKRSMRALSKWQRFENIFQKIEDC